MKVKGLTAKGKLKKKTIKEKLQDSLGARGYKYCFRPNCNRQRLGVTF